MSSDKIAGSLCQRTWPKLSSKYAWSSASTQFMAALALLLLGPPALLPGDNDPVRSQI